MQADIPSRLRRGHLFDAEAFILAEKASYGPNEQQAYGLCRHFTLIVNNKMNRQTLFARRVFFWAGIYGILVLAPLYFMEGKLARDFPPAFSHPEQFYGFIGVALAWQFAFLLIASDVPRYRLFMLPAIAEKLLSSISALILYAADRVAAMTAAPAVVDLFLALLFIVAFFRCRGLDGVDKDGQDNAVNVAQARAQSDLAHKSAQGHLH